MSATSPYQSAQTPISVEIDLSGTVYVLQPKFSAMKAVNRMTGNGFTGTFKALQNYDVDAFAAIIAAGVGATGKAAQDIERQVYEHGVEDLIQPVTRYVNILIRGGREPDAAVDDTAD